MPLKTGPLTAEDFQAIWSAALDPSYRDPFLAAGDGEGLEAHGQMWATFARVSRAIDETTQELYVQPWSGQTAAPAAGEAKSQVVLSIARSKLLERPLRLRAGQVFADEVQTDWGPQGGERVVTGRRYVLKEDLVFHPGDAGPFTVPGEAARPGRGYDNPMPGTIVEVEKPGANFTNDTATVVATYPAPLGSVPAAQIKVTAPNKTDMFIPEHVGQALLFTAGANAGKVGRVDAFFAPQPSGLPPVGSAVLLEPDVSVEATVFAGAFAVGEKVIVKNGPTTIVEGTALGTRTAAGTKKLTFIFLDGSLAPPFGVGNTVTGAASGATLTVSRVSFSETFSSEVAAATWRILDWVDDWDLSCTNAASPAGGKSPMLDEAGAERAIDRSSGETDDSYRKRVAQIADVVSPNAIRRALNRALGTLPWSFREVGSLDFPGFYFDGDVSPPHFVPGGGANDAYDFDTFAVVHAFGPSAFAFQEAAQVIDAANNLYALGWVGRQDGAGPTTLTFIRRAGTFPSTLPLGLKILGLHTGAFFDGITSVTPSPSFAARRFHVWLDYEQFRAFFFVGVPRSDAGEFGFFYAGLPAGSPGYSLGAYDASPFSAFFDGFPQAAATLYKRVAASLDAAKAGGVGYSLFIDDELTFTPAKLAGLWAWFEMDSVVLSPDVSQVNDKSGNLRHATVPGGGSQPVLNPVQAWAGGQPTITILAAGSAVLRITAAAGGAIGPRTVFVVLKRSGVAGRIFSQVQGVADYSFARHGGFASFQEARTSGAPPGGDSSWAANGGATIPDTNGHVWTYRFDGSHATQASWLDGAAQVLTDNTTAVPGTATITADFFLGGEGVGLNILDHELAAMIVYSKALLDSDRMLVEQYLATRFNL